MNNFEVEEPILNSPYEEPAVHWQIEEGRLPEIRSGRRQAGYFYRDPKAPISSGEHEARGQWVSLTLVNQIREQMKDWRKKNYPGVTGTTLELLKYWQREGRQHRLFFAQLEAVETIIFLNEARTDFLQGIDIPIDETSDDRRANGYNAFKRYACKMATGSGKTTVMGMLAAWSILNKGRTETMEDSQTLCLWYVLISRYGIACRNLPRKEEKQAFTAPVILFHCTSCLT
jgi:type III restriction enzyme